LEHYQAAVTILLGQLKGKLRAIDESSKNDEAEIKGNIVRALISQAEIWMDPSYDLWYVGENQFSIDLPQLSWLVLNRTRKRTARIFSRLLYRPILATLRLYRHLRLLGCLSSVQEMPSNALNKPGRSGKTSTSVSFVLLDRPLSF
jgi:hypothetical protein